MNIDCSEHRNRHILFRKKFTLDKTGKTLLFEEMISLIALYQIDADIISGARECGTIIWTAEQFAALSGTPGLENYGNGVKLEGLTQKTGTTNQWYSAAPKVAAKDMADMQYYYLGYVVDADGNVHYSGVISYGFEQYMYNIVTGGKASEKMVEFAKRLFVYERAAETALKG